MIAKKYDGFIHLSMGELLRRRVSENTDDELWSRIGQKMSSGDVVPSVGLSVFAEILLENLSRDYVHDAA